MEKQESVGAAGGLNGESPGGGIRGVPGGIGGVESGAGLLSGVTMFHGSGPSTHNGGTIIRSPDSSQPSGGTAVLGTGLNQHPGEVAGHSFGSRTKPDGFNPPFPGTSVSGTFNPGSGASGLYNSANITISESTCMRQDRPCEDRPRSILKNSSSITVHKSPRAERRKSQHWDEMNILATYHPADKNYGFMKVDEPSTPFLRLQDSDEDLLAGTSHAMTPEKLAERFAAMDNVCPKVLYSDNRSSGSSDSFSKTPSPAFRNLSPTSSATVVLEKEIDLQRKEYYSKGRYLRCWPHPELEEDTEDEQQSSPTNLNWVIESPMSTEVRLLDHTGSSSQDFQATESSRKVIVTSSKLGTARCSKDSGSQAMSDWCQWLVSKGLNWQSKEGSEREPGSHPNFPNQNQHRQETLRLQWTQEEETRQWKL
ncbi:uncharacterized protein [Ovis canadensis]|uniref:uncharacterized protein isoform X2 n=1 Tax=Ovis canadensis TaxID=37174 RepID=UPI0037528D06